MCLESITLYLVLDFRVKEKSEKKMGFISLTSTNVRQKW